MGNTDQYIAMHAVYNIAVFAVNAWSDCFCIL